MAVIRISSDPIADAEDWQEALEEEQRWFEEHSPLCPLCGRRTGEVSNQGYYLFGQWFCEDCVTKAHRDLPHDW